MNTNANQPTTQGVKAKPKRTRRPKRATIDRQRREKLLAVLRHVEIAVASGRCSAEQIEAAAPLITTAVAEIATINGLTDATGSAVDEYGTLIAEALGWLDDPHPAFDLWSEIAPGHLAAAADRRSRHIERAERDGESQLHLERITSLEMISVALNLTRPRIREIFGKDGCALPPVKVRDHRFTPEERKELRTLAKRTGYGRKRLGDLKHSMTPEAFEAMVADREAQLLSPERAEHYRILADQSDVAVSKMVAKPGPYMASCVQEKKPGPKPKRETLARQIKAVASRCSRSPDTVERWMYGLKAQFPVDEIPAGDTCRIAGVTISDPYLLYLVENPLYDGSKTRAHPHIDLIIRHRIAIGKGEPSAALIRKWNQRKKLKKMAEAAKAWEREIKIQVADAIDANNHAQVFGYSKGTTENARSSAGAVQPLEDVLGESDTQPFEAPLPEDDGDCDVRSRSGRGAGATSKAEIRAMSDRSRHAPPRT